MSAARELQKAVFDALVADGDVHSVIKDRIYDRMPSSGDYPCVTFGPMDATEGDSDCIGAQEITMQLDAWSVDQGRLNPCMAIVWAVRQALHRATPTIADPYSIAAARVVTERTVLDPDGVTAHGIIVFRVMVENG